MGKKSSRYEPYAPCDSKCHMGKCDNPEHTVNFIQFRAFVNERMNNHDRRVQYTDYKRTKHFKDWIKNQTRLGLKCFYCHKDLSDGKYHVDHYYPLARKGRNSTANFEISCPTCNLRKGAKDPIDFTPIKSQKYIRLEMIML